jgi:FKBP-type peptidyl-prolyl cis-trans isomerase
MQLKYLIYLGVIVVPGLSAALNISAGDENQHGSTPQAGLQNWNEIDKEAIETESGLKYKILISGNGRKPKARTTVKVHYRGLLLDGREFDSSYNQTNP